MSTDKTITIGADVLKEIIASAIEQGIRGAGAAIPAGGEEMARIARKHAAIDAKAPTQVRRDRVEITVDVDGLGSVLLPCVLLSDLSREGEQWSHEFSGAPVRWSGWRVYNLEDVDTSDAEAKALVLVSGWFAPAIAEAERMGDETRKAELRTKMMSPQGMGQGAFGVRHWMWLVRQKALRMTIGRNLETLGSAVKLLGEVGERITTQKYVEGAIG